jgi:hypothetical protein
MGGRINTIMQTCFFALAKLLPEDVAIRKAIEKSYARKSRKVVEKNFVAVDMALSRLEEVRRQKLLSRDLKDSQWPDDAKKQPAGSCAGSSFSSCCNAVSSSEAGSPRPPLHTLIHNRRGCTPVR